MQTTGRPQCALAPWQSAPAASRRRSSAPALIRVAVRNLEQQTTGRAELLEVGSERFQRKPAWDIAGTAREEAAEAQRAFEAAARDLLGPRLERLG